MWYDSLYQSLIGQISLVGISDVLDVLIITFVVYKLLKFIRDTKTIQLLKGIIVLVVGMQVSQLVKLHTVHYLLSSAMQMGLIAVIVVFQPELRRALEQLGRTPFGRWLRIKSEDTQDDAEKERIIREIKESCASMSKSHIGALIVMEREIKIGDVVRTGTILNADVSSGLLTNIFIPKTPLHDGAVIIRNNKIEAAACFLPLSQNPNVSKELGTRHRAGLGISEETDAVVVIVSEETGGISIACGGELNMRLTPDELEKNLEDLFELNKKDPKAIKNIFARKEKNKQ